MVIENEQRVRKMLEVKDVEGNVKKIDGILS